MKTHHFRQDARKHAENFGKKIEDWTVPALLTRYRVLHQMLLQSKDILLNLLDHSFELIIAFPGGVIQPIEMAISGVGIAEISLEYCVCSMSMP